MPLEVKQGCFLTGETSAIKILTKAENDAELEKTWSMTPQQTSVIAMEVVAEAETTIKVLTKAGIDAELENDTSAGCCHGCEGSCGGRSCYIRS